jgi:hypothetical protein
MRKLDASVSIITFACLIMLFISQANSLAMAQEFPHLTAEQAIAAASRNAKPGSSLKILREIVTNADMRRIGDQALEQAQMHKIELLENGRLVNILRSGGYLFAEIDPRTDNIVAMHLILMEAGGAVKDVESTCHGVVTLADTAEVIKDTVELVKQLYSTPSTDESSLASKFYGGNFPDADQFPDSLFIIPDSLRKLGAKANEVREAAALFWGYALWATRYALSMPAFSASTAATEDAAEKERDTLKAEFLQNNNMDPNINPIDFDNIHSEKQLQERIELLTRLDRFLEDSLRKKADPAVVGANLSVLTMPLSVDVDLNQAGQYVSSSPPKSLFLWHRVATGGFAVKEITWDW